MRHHQKGFGLQAVLSIGVIVAIGFVAAPAYESFISKAKITEAMTIAGESKRRAAEFVTLNGRFPQSQNEALVVKTNTITAPEYVREMVVDTENENHEIVIRVYLKEGVVENPGGQEQYIYIAGDLAVGSGAHVQWSCGARGVDSRLMPENCQG